MIFKHLPKFSHPRGHNTFLPLVYYLSLVGIWYNLRNAENIPRMDRRSNPNKGNSTSKNNSTDKIRLKQRPTRPKSSTTYRLKSKIPNFGHCLRGFVVCLKQLWRQFLSWEVQLLRFEVRVRGPCWPRGDWTLMGGCNLKLPSSSSLSHWKHSAKNKHQLVPESFIILSMLSLQ